MKRMGSDNDKSRQGLWNETERYFENQIQGLKTLKRQKSPAKSFVWANELKRQFTYTLKPSKCSNTDLSKIGYKSGNGNGNEEKNSQQIDEEQVKLKPKEKKFFSDMNIEKIFVNSEYFKMKNGNTGSMSFCSGENGENRWTIETNATGRKTVSAIKNGYKNPKEVTMLTNENTTKSRKPNQTKKPEENSQPDVLKSVKDKLDIIIEDIKLLNRDFGLVRMDLKMIEKLLRLQKKVTKSRMMKKDGNEDENDDINQKFGRYSEEVEKAAQELRDFIDTNGTLLLENDDNYESPDFDTIINNLHRLSETAYQPKIIQTSKGAKFEVPREMPISLYADGILLRNTEFRKYTDMRVRLFFRDIEDGFFPSELWPEYPCGVPFQVTDRRFENFNDGNFEFTDNFPGNGHRLGSVFDNKSSSMVYLPPTKYPEMSGDSKLEKKIPNSFISQENFKHLIRCKSAPRQSYSSVAEDVINAKPLSLKVRLGMGKEGYLNLNIMSNDRMSQFQDILFKKLCEKYHNDYVRDVVDFRYDNNKCGDIVPDFEIHVYGRKPFRLSENLNSHPSECGIFNNCVINITEI